MSHKRFLAALAAAVAALAVAAPVAPAFGPIDQQQPDADGAIVMPPGIAQTFTVGRTGKLDAFSLSSPSSARISFQIYDLRADGTPDVSRPRLTQNGTASLLAGTPADIAVSPVAVSAGDRLALAIGTIRSYASDDLATAGGDRYPAGQLFQVSGYWTFEAVAGVDLQFATHVTAAPAVTQLALKSLASTAGRPTALLTTGTALAPLPGKVVTFSLLRSTGAVKDQCTATTDLTGTATCTSKRWSIPAGGSLRATFAGDADYAPATATIAG